MLVACDLAGERRPDKQTPERIGALAGRDEGVHDALAHRGK